MSKPLPIFTIQTFNQAALQAAGSVFVQRVESISIARNFFAGVTGVAGGRSTMMEKKMNDLTQALMQELDSQAKKMYPNAVALVNVQVHFSDIGKNDQNMFLAGQASATILIKRVKPVGQTITPSQPVQSEPLASAPLQIPSAPLQMQKPIEHPGQFPRIGEASNLVIPKPISGGKKPKRKSFISKSRTFKKYK
jgi:uncharacterized protein YbjQ (UPF0145 family)